MKLEGKVTFPVTIINEEGVTIIVPQEFKEHTSGTITLGDKAKCNILDMGKGGSDSPSSLDDVL